MTDFPEPPTWVPEAYDLYLIERSIQACLDRPFRIERRGPA